MMEKEASKGGTEFLIDSRQKGKHICSQYEEGESVPPAHACIPLSEKEPACKGCKYQFKGV